MIKTHKFLLGLTTLAFLGGCLKPPQKVDGGVTSLPYRPLRIVSINPCADAILMQVADKSQIKAISYYSQDPKATSIDLSLASQFPKTFDTAEEVIAFKPDLVVAGAHVALPTVAALQRLKIPVVNVGVPKTIQESKEQISLLANITGNPQKGLAVNNNIDKAIQNAKSNTQIPAIIWQANGLTPGSETLANEMLNIAGFKNKSGDYGIKSWGNVPLETLLSDAPKILMTKDDKDGSDTILSHPVVKKVGTKILVVDYRPSYLTCAGPVMIDAFARLKQIHNQYEKPPQTIIKRKT